jgi:rod shape-determining protein MreC
VNRKRHLILLSCLLVAQLVMLSVQVRGNRDQPAPGNFLFKVFGPVAKVATGAVASCHKAWKGYVDLRGARRQCRALEVEVRELRMQVDVLEETRRQNQRLHRLLAMKKEHGWREAVGARVVTLHRGPTARTLVLNRGTRHGLAPDMPVVTADGVVGRIVTAGPGTAKVQLLNDPAAATAVVFERSRDQASGIAAGGTGPGLEVRYISNLADIRPGDMARTSGLEGIYPPGLPVGRVVSVQNQADLMKEIELLPAAALGRLEEVLVLRGVHDATQEEEAAVARR